MTTLNSLTENPAPSPDSAFVRYYAEQSVSPETLLRFQTVRSMIERTLRARGREPVGLQVADIGCGAATQCLLWARGGHSMHGLDINEELIALGRTRATEAGASVDLRVGTAADLPWPSASMDVCLVPELLEHVADWQVCLQEFARILRPGGVLYLSTTNTLCPAQAEFDLPLYSWYPAALKHHFERLAVTTRPELVSHATYPAINWFTFYSLRRALQAYGFEPVLDRFDLIDTASQGGITRCALAMVRAVAALRWLGQVVTPYTVALAFRGGAPSLAAPSA